jgi:hypothetical protein
MLGTSGRAALFDLTLCGYQVNSCSFVCLLFARDLLAAMHD